MYFFPDPNDPSIPDDEITGVGEFYTDVPEGGDARYTAATCDQIFSEAALDTLHTTLDQIKTTPHFLRSLGRRQCTLIERFNLPADEYVAQWEESNRAIVNGGQPPGPHALTDELVDNGVATTKAAIEYLCPSLK
ncbi:hypothetical protein DVG80_33790 [Rhodococcus erythropolis]|nr:hypothetical protein DVG80_33790 [Rhodococcus erythropolis]